MKVFSRKAVNDMKSYGNVNCDIRSCSQREKRKVSVAQTMEKQKAAGRDIAIIENTKGVGKGMANIENHKRKEGAWP